MASSPPKLLMLNLILRLGSVLSAAVASKSGIYSFPTLLRSPHNSSCPFLKQHYTICVIHSSPENFKRRMFIRETWGRKVDNYYFSFSTVFVLGQTENVTLEKRLEAESAKYQDILQGEFADSYKNLSLKSIVWLNWTSRFCPRASFVLKVDDDVFVNVQLLLHHIYYLRTNGGNFAEKTIGCFLWTGGAPNRNTESKWFVSKEEFPDSRYKPYCSGSAYILTGDLTPLLLKQSQETKLFWVDDYWVTGHLGSAVNVSYRNFNSIYAFPSSLEEIQAVIGSEHAIFAHLPFSGALAKLYRIWNKML